MNVKCKQCGTAFGVDDSKVENKKFAFVCPKCSTRNVFDNRKKPEDMPVVSDFDNGAGEPTQLAVKNAAVVDDFDFLAGIDEGIKSPVEVETEPDGFSLDDIGEPFADVSQPETELDGFSLDDIDEPFADVSQPETELDGFSLDDIDEPLADISQPETELDGFSLDDIDEPLADISEIGAESDDLPLSIDIEPDEFSVAVDSEEFEHSEFLNSEFTDDIPGADPSLLGADISLFEDASAQEGADVNELPTLSDDDFFTEIESTSETVFPSDSENVDDDGLPDLDEDIFKELPAFDWQSDIDTIDDKVADFPENLQEITSSDLSDEDEEDENITIDLDSLDIIIKEAASSLEENQPVQEENQSVPFEDEDESLTLDLDSLDISIDENEEFKERILSDEDEKLTLDDAGLTLEDLIESDGEDYFLDTAELESEYDDRLNIEEVYPSAKFGVDEFDETESMFTRSMSEEYDDLETEEAEEFEKIEDTPGRWSTAPEPQGELLFSIDYSLKYSRLKAISRLFMPLFLLAMIPHLVVMLIYTVLSFILGAVNAIVVLFTGKPVRDFLEIMEQAVRYSIAIQSSAMGIIDEFPVFAGKKDINHSLQVDIEYAENFSRFWAAMRFSVVGIIIAALPHLLICAIISCLLPVLFLMCALSIIFTGTLPYVLLEIVSRVFRYSTRIISFMIGLIDKYPSFKF